MRVWLVALTQFGDIALLLPLAAVILVWLLLMRTPRSAWWWAIAVAFCAGLTAVLKVSFYECPPTPALHSPSGHTSLSTLVYGALTLVTATQCRGLPRIIAIVGGGGFILAIGASRMLLNIHSGPEVALGLVIGVATLAVFAHTYPAWRGTGRWLSTLFASTGMFVLLMYGRELHAERFIRAFADYLQIQCA